MELWNPKGTPPSICPVFVMFLPTDASAYIWLSHLTQPLTVLCSARDLSHAAALGLLAFRRSPPHLKRGEQSCCLTESVKSHSSDAEPFSSLSDSAEIQAFSTTESSVVHRSVVYYYKPPACECHGRENDRFSNFRHQIMSLNRYNAKLFMVLQQGLILSFESGRFQRSPSHISDGLQI